MPDAATLEDLARRGFKSVISLRYHDTSDREPTERAGMRWIQIPVRDHLVPSFEQVDEFLALVPTQRINRPSSTAITASVARAS
jgi:hypothetical protein